MLSDTYLLSFTNLGDLFTHQPQLFSSCLRIFHFLCVILPFSLFCSELIICFSLAYSYQRPPGTPETSVQAGGQMGGLLFLQALCLVLTFGSLQSWGLWVQTTAQHSCEAYLSISFGIPTHLLCILLCGRVHSCDASCLKTESKKQKTSNFRHVDFSYQIWS